MIRTRSLRAPIITILSPCLAASKRVVSLLSLIGDMKEVSLLDEDSSSSDKALNETFKSSIPGLSRSWESIAARCRVSGSVIHFCSSRKSGSSEENGNSNLRKNPFALLAITDDGESVRKENSCEDAKVKESIRGFRDLLAARINDGTTNSTILNLKCLMSGKMTTKDLLKDISSDGLPLLSIPESKDDPYSRKSEEKDEVNSASSPFLKEIVVPYFDYASYSDGSTLMSKLSRAATNRPTVGVYEWPNSTTCIRPLPTAAEDQKLPSPSIIFHCETPEDSVEFREHGFREARIGYGGLGPGHGQVMLLHPDLIGLDIRYCPRTTVSSTFSEAQESLLAGSLDELQSANVLASGGGSSESDEKIGNGDCWVEVRSNLKRPSNFWQKSKKMGSNQKIAKIPDLPYE